MNEEKAKGFVKKYWKEYVKGVIISVGCTVCFIAGYKSCQDMYNTSLSAMCVADPELKGRIVNAAKMVNERLS